MRKSGELESTPLIAYGRSYSPFYRRVLADTQGRGKLDSTEFIIAMYFIHARMSSLIEVLPSTLPSGLLEQAKGKSTSAATLQPNIYNGGGSAYSPAISRQSTPDLDLSTPVLQPTPYSRGHQNGASTSTIPQAQLPPAPTDVWVITPDERATSDHFFDKLDIHKRGFVERDLALPFFAKSHLSEHTTELIWYGLSCILILHFFSRVYAGLWLMLTTTED